LRIENGELKMDKMIKLINLSPKAIIAAGLYLLVSVWQVQAQDAMAERLLQMEQEVASGTLSDDEMFTHYHQLIIHYGTRDFEKTKLYFQKGVEFAQAKKRVEWEAQLLGKMGHNYFEWGERDSILIFYDRAAKLIEGKEHYLFESQIYKAIGSYYDNINQKAKALNAYYQSLELLEKDKQYKLAHNQDVTENNLRQAYTIHDIGTLYYGLRNFEKAVENMLRAKQILDDNPHDSNSFIETFLFANLASYYMELGQNDKALPYLLLANELAMKHQYLQLVVFVSRKFSDYYRAEKDLPKSLHYAKEALQTAEQTGQPALLNWADVAMMETSIELKDNQTALYHAVRIAERTEDDDWDTLQALYKGLILIHSSMNNPGKVAENLKKLNEITTIISDKNLQDALQDMEVKYDVQQKDFDLERKQAVIERQTVIRNVIFIGLAGALLVVALLAVIAVQRKKRNRVLFPRNNALSELNATKDKFFSIISHDLKNPAVAQRDALALLIKKAHLWDKEKLTAYYHELLKSADGQVDLLYNLLGWAQIQTGRMTYNPDTFTISDLLENLTLIRKMAENKGITLSTQIPQTGLITCDGNMFSTVIRNLLTNAVKFTSAGGQVTLAIEANDNGQYTISVSDNGIGMSREQIQKLFMLDNTQSRKGTSGEEGTGLGLIVCREMLEKHETTLNVESEVGKGSKFWFELKA